MPGLRVSGAPFQPIRKTAGAAVAAVSVVGVLLGIALLAQPASSKTRIMPIKRHGLLKNFFVVCICSNLPLYIAPAKVRLSGEVGKPK